MRLFLLIAMLLPAPAFAYVDVSDVVVQKGMFKDEECAASPAAKDSKLSCLCEADVSYPQISGLGGQQDAINAAFKQRAQRSLTGERVSGLPCLGKEVDAYGQEEKGSSIAMAGKVSFENDTLLQIVLEGSSYGEGAAHPMRWTDGKTIDKTAKRELATTDILRVDRLTALNAQIFRELKANPNTFLGSGVGQYDMSRGDSGYSYLTRNECNGCALLIDAKGAYVLFSIYSVAPYVAGEIRFDIPKTFIAHSAIQKLYLQD